MRIKDNSFTPKEDCAKIQGIVRTIADKSLGELEREGIFVFPNAVQDAEDMDKDQMVLRSFNHSYVTSNIMGFIGLGNERLEITSRFSKGDDDFFFQYLMERVLEWPTLVRLETKTNLDENVLNLFLFMFPQYLKGALRKGIFKTYIRKEYNDSNVKGTIDVARHVRLNTPFMGKIAYNKREYSYDNYLIELIRHTIEYIKRKPYGNRVLEPVKDEVKLIVEASPDYKVGDRRKIIEANKKNVVRHAYYHEYRHLQQLCILILQNEKHQMGSGNRNIFGILFDGAWLWEEYVNQLIGQSYYHPMNKAGKGVQWLFTNPAKQDSYYGKIYPDFISRHTKGRIVADAKYKPEKNIKDRDYLQVLAYMLRFDAKKGFYLYPETETYADTKLLVNRGTSYEQNVRPREDVMVVKHGLKIPQNVENYEQFVDAMKVAEKEFVKSLLEG